MSRIIESPVPKPTVGAAILGERRYQEFKFAEQNTLGEHVALIQKHADLLTSVFTKSDPRPAMEYVRKVAALAVRCMEENGLVFREGYGPNEDGSYSDINGRRID